MLPVMLYGSVFVLVVLYKFWTWNFNYWKVRGVPGPEPSLIYGNTKSFVSKSNSYCLEVEQIYNNYKDSGLPIVGYFAGRRPHLLAIDAVAVKTIMIQNFANFSDNEVADMMSLASDPIIAGNPFFQHSQAWKNTRRELAPGLTQNRVKSYYPIIRRVCQQLHRTLNEKCNRSTAVDMDDVTGRFTADVCCDVIFAIDASALSETPYLAFEMGKRFIGKLGKLSTFMIWTGFLPFLKKLYKWQILDDEESKFFKELIQESIRVREMNEPRGDFLQFLANLKRNKGVDVTELTAHALTFYLNGYDTSSLAIAKTLQELAKNQYAQEKLRQEIQETLNGTGEEDLSFDDLMNLEYLDAVINESLRLNPPINLLVKKCTKDFELCIPGHSKPIKISSGTPVMVHIAAIHRDPRNYANPLSFDPDRFLVSDAKKLNEEGMLLSFGCGPRICIGMKFALAQIKACVCDVIRHFKLTPDLEDPRTRESTPAHFLNYPSKRIILKLQPI